MLPDCLDHSPVLLSTEITRSPCKKPFRLLTILMHLEEYRAAVKLVWGQHVLGHKMYKNAQSRKRHTKGILFNRK